MLGLSKYPVDWGNLFARLHCGYNFLPSRVVFEVLRMPSQQKASLARNANKVRNPTPHVPSEYRQWVKGRVVNLSTATKYYKKIWDVYKELASSHVKEHG